MLELSNKLRLVENRENVLWSINYQKKSERFQLVSQDDVLRCLVLSTTQRY